MPNIDNEKQVDKTKPIKFFATCKDKDGDDCLIEETVMEFKNYDDMTENAGFYAFFDQFNRPPLTYWWVYADEDPTKDSTTRIECRFNFQGSDDDEEEKENE